jgi:hypothetical protein
VVGPWCDQQQKRASVDKDGKKQASILQFAKKASPPAPAPEVPGEVPSIGLPAILCALQSCESHDVIVEIGLRMCA